MSMISKKTFCEALALIKEQEATDEQFSKALSKVGDGHFLFGVGNKYLVALRLVLKEAIGDKYDYIDWWLYEATDDFTVSMSDNSKSWDLREPEALYDYIVNECT